MGAPTQDFLSSLASLLQTGKYSDLTIVGETQRYNVHKAIVCPRSDFFEGACNGHFMESRNGEIDLSDEEEDLIEHMLSYFYYLDYLMEAEAPTRSKATYSRSASQRGAVIDMSLVEDPLLAQAAMSGMKQAAAISIAPGAGKRTSSPRRNSRSRANSRAMTPPESPCYDDNEFEDEDVAESDLVTHARVYAAAEKYGIPGLKALAQQKFEIQVASRWNDVDFLDAMEEVYASTVDSDRGLRNVVVHVFRAHPQLARQQTTKAVVDDIAPLAQELRRLTCTRTRRQPMAKNE